MTNSQRGPFLDFLNSDLEGVVRREVVTYRVVNGTLRKETATRDYYGDEDYHDTSSTLPLSLKK